MKLALIVLALSTLATAQSQPSGPVRVSAGVMTGRIVTKVPPVYPPEARAQGISGSVVLHAIIGRDGGISNLTVVSGPEIFQEAAISAVSQWTYKPYLLNGVPTEIDTTITVNFLLAPPPSPGDTPSLTAGPVRVSGGVMAGQILSKTTPVFPPIAKTDHISGAGVIHVIIGKDGHIKSITYVSGPEALREAYVDAVSQWVYRPYLLNGQPVEVDTTVTMNFNYGADQGFVG